MSHGECEFTFENLASCARREMERREKAFVKKTPDGRLSEGQKEGIAMMRAIAEYFEAMAEASPPRGGLLP